MGCQLLRNFLRHFIVVTCKVQDTMDWMKRIATKKGLSKVIRVKARLDIVAPEGSNFLAFSGLT